MGKAAQIIIVVMGLAGLFFFALTRHIPGQVSSDISHQQSSKKLLPDGQYTVKKSVAGANSMENLAQMDYCIERSDQACEAAMLLDARAYLVETGTVISGEEEEDSIFCGTAESGALAGKEVCLPAGAIR